MNLSPNVSIKSLHFISYNSTWPRSESSAQGVTQMHANKSHPQMYFVTVLCLYHGTCNTSYPSGVNAGFGCTLCSGKGEADAQAVVLSDLDELSSLEEIMILRL